MKIKKLSNRLEKVLNGFEIGIAILLLVVIVIKIIETYLNLAGVAISVFDMDFLEILSSTLGFVIGVEFVKMLCKHTPESVVDVLLFTVARQMVVYHSNAWDLMIGVVVIAMLFGTKRFLIIKKVDKSEEPEVKNTEK